MSIGIMDKVFRRYPNGGGISGRGVGMNAFTSVRHRGLYWRHAMGNGSLAPGWIGA